MSFKKPSSLSKVKIKEGSLAGPGSNIYSSATQAWMMHELYGKLWWKNLEEAGGV